MLTASNRAMALQVIEDLGLSSPSYVPSRMSRPNMMKSRPSAASTTLASSLLLVNKTRRRCQARPRSPMSGSCHR
jgi:hypothetical protein